MSQWTHVCGCIRVDAIQGLTSKIDFKKILGNIIEYETDGEWNTKLPLGSEGSIKYDIWTNSDMGEMYAYTISIFGDLRDYEDKEEIKEWFKNVCLNSGLMIRDAVLSIQVEYKSKIILWYDAGYGKQRIEGIEVQKNSMNKKEEGNGTDL